MSGQRQSSSKGRRQGDDSISLRVLDSGDRRTMRPSKMGRRRAIVLGTVQALLIAHVVLWVFMGRTTTPIEPSESMEFVKHGVVNVGLIFFGLALLSTMILGRWFCGWGCHVILLQDLCGWFMKKCGIRPKPFRSRLLVYVPLVLALYMFVWPAVYRWGVVPTLDRLSPPESGVVRADRLPPWHLQAQLTTEEFWKTFPGVMVAIPFLAICGFGTVYFLGSKGYCTYGCPYGGFFAPMDELAPGRIRVTDACEHCGHCTAACTSNVRVHEEVREYGMVVDSGCMKCMDCVSVCPNDALYFGFGRPGVGKGEARNKKPKRSYDMSWPEEIVFAGVFLLSFVSVRGVYGVVPMLMAAGIAGIATFLAWKLWRLFRDVNVNLHRHRLKFKGRMSLSGWVFALISILSVVLVAHSGIVQASQKGADVLDGRVLVPLHIVYNENRGVNDIDESTVRTARHAATLYQIGSGFEHGGIALSDAGQGFRDIRRAWLLSVADDHANAERVLLAAIARDGGTESLNQGVALTRQAQGDVDGTMAWYREVLINQTGHVGMIEGLSQFASAKNRANEAIGILSDRLEAFPEDRASIFARALLQLDTGQEDDGYAGLTDLAWMMPDNELRFRQAAMGILVQTSPVHAAALFEQIVRQRGDDWEAMTALGDAYAALGRHADARKFHEKAIQVRRDMGEQARE